MISLACETLGVLRSLFGLFSDFLTKIDSMKTMKFDINLEYLTSKIKPMYN
jgi:hypothetical protein